MREPKKEFLVDYSLLKAEFRTLVFKAKGLSKDLLEAVSLNLDWTPDFADSCCTPISDVGLGVGSGFGFSSGMGL